MMQGQTVVTLLYSLKMLTLIIAIDLFVGTVTRTHYDIDFCVLLG